MSLYKMLSNTAVISLSRLLISNSCLPVAYLSRYSATLSYPHLQTRKPLLRSNSNPENIRIEVRGYAARKGTRTRKEKKKVKKEEVKKVFVFNQLKKQASMVYQQQRPVEDPTLLDAIDDVFFHEKFRTVSYAFADAVQNHKDVHHPTMFNFPKSPLIVKVGVDLVYPNRPNKFQDGWKQILEMRAPFLLDGMHQPTVLVFCPADTEMIDAAIKAGADTAGSTEIIKSIQEGLIEPETYDYFVSHPSMVNDLTSIRGLIKKKFPTTKAKTISMDVAGAVRRLKSGIEIKLIKTDREPDFGYIETPIGKLDMNISDLESNFEAVFFDTVSRRVAGKLPEDYIIRCSLTTPHTAEILKIDISKYLAMVPDEKKKAPVKVVENEVKEDDNPPPTTMAVGQ